tara:strand:- start:37 stop:390 length:354 start_codon:yes stop_codon:yes gene_type:complete
MEILNNIGDWIKENAKEFPLYLSLLIFGGLGAAFANYSSKRELTRTQRFVSIVSGAFAALFVAVIVEKVAFEMWDITLSGSVMAAIGYFSGHIGLEGVTRIILRVTRKNAPSKDEEK